MTSNLEKSQIKKNTRAKRVNIVSVKLVKESREDIEVTKRLTKAGKLMGIELLDHLIIGDGKYESLKEKGYI